MWWQKYKDNLIVFQNRWAKFTSPSFQLIISGIGLCYFLALLSLLPQLPGLIGERGLLPAILLKQAYAMTYGVTGAWEMKSLAWWVNSGTGLQALTIVGLMASLGVVLGRFTKSSLFLAWLIYGSLFVAGQAFLSFQWDSLLLEAGIVGICLSWANKSDAKNTWAALLLVRLLAMKVMLSAGLAKILSGDIWWREGTALTVHFETQPLPTVFGWVAHQQPFSVLVFGVIFMWIAELIAPLLAFIPGRCRFYSSLCMILFQLVIMATGNYGFFNILTIVLLLSFWVKTPLREPLCTGLAMTEGWKYRLLNSLRSLRNAVKGHSLASILPLLLSLTLLLGMGNRYVVQSPTLGMIEGVLAQWRIQFQYGLFAVMTYPRWEISFTVSEDHKTWEDVPFYYKPTVMNQLPWVTPHMPRLDWLMWFAALHPAPQQLIWIQRLADGIIKKEPAILALLPPLPKGDFRYIQIHRQQYRFTDTDEYEKRGDYWVKDTQSY
jgi:hypothetical protein